MLGEEETYWMEVLDAVWESGVVIAGRMLLMREVCALLR